MWLPANINARRVRAISEYTEAGDVKIVRILTKNVNSECITTNFNNRCSPTSVSTLPKSKYSLLS